jgi:hypothetical protein
VPTRFAGLLLFLPVPLVLFLFTRAPLGILWSLGLGVTLVLTHRFYARPWALARSNTRCLWCGADVSPDAAPAPALEIVDPLGRASWRTCSEAHARSERAVLGWAQRHGAFLKLGILGTLAVFVAWALAAGLGWLGGRSFADAVAFFRLAVAATVLMLAWLAPRFEPGDTATAVQAPFPVHLSALIGLGFVLWLFRLVGLIWLAQGVLHLAQSLTSFA